MSKRVTKSKLAKLGIDINTLEDLTDPNNTNPVILNGITEESNSEPAFDRRMVRDIPSDISRVVTGTQRECYIKELDPNKIIHPLPEDYLSPDRYGGSKIVVIGKPGCFEYDTPVKMFDKSTKYVQDVKVGDKVMGDDGKARTVSKLYRDIDSMFKVKAEDDFYYTVNSNHILSLLTDDNKHVDISVSKYLSSADKMLPVYTYRSDENGRIYDKRKFVLEYSGEYSYYGFEIDGNKRFLLEDNTVVHNTGKSWVIRSIIHTKSFMIPVGQFFSGTEDTNNFYKSFVPDDFVYEGYEEGAYGNFIRRQKLARQYLPNAWAVCGMDDVTEDEKFLRTPIMKGTYKNGRHWDMLHFLGLQYSMDIKPNIRALIDGTFIMRETNPEYRKKLWVNYSSAVPDVRDFYDIMDTVNTDYGALFVRNNHQSSNFEDCIFYYKAHKPPDDWTFGCPEYWDFYRQRYEAGYVRNW